MLRIFTPIAAVLALANASQAVDDSPGAVLFDTVIFEEDFDQPDGSRPDPDSWVVNVPDSWWWVLGRTFLPSPMYHPEGPLPQVRDGACCIEHHLFNPYHLGTPKTTFLGGEIHTVMAFDSTRPYRFEATVRWSECPKGLVSSFFTYGYDAEHADSDEIDFEFLSNHAFEPSQPRVLTNTWNDSVQDPAEATIPELDLPRWQTFRIYWYPGRVDWVWVESLGDERLLRSETDPAYLPDEPVALYFNFWAPTSDWPLAYEVGLQPDQQDQGVKYEYWIDRVEVRVGRNGPSEEPRDWYRDADGDQYGNPGETTLSVAQPPGYVSIDNDCDDTKAAVNPAAAEICNGLDDDCNGRIDDTPLGCPRDRDEDGVEDESDNCPDTPNPGQADADSDEEGDDCDRDADNDGILDEEDNCPDTPNPLQEDADSDDTGDACDEPVRSPAPGRRSNMCGPVSLGAVLVVLLGLWGTKALFASRRDVQGRPGPTP